jgi:selenocysteine lyase/cysteine desulfurase
VPADRDGKIRIGDFEERDPPQYKGHRLHACFQSDRNVNDLAEIGDIARRHGLIFIADASQTAGCLEINMQEMNIDVLCFSGTQGALMGPQGHRSTSSAGRRGDPSVEDRRNRRAELSEEPAGRISDPGWRPGTLNSHGIAGLSAALDFIKETGISVIREKETALMRRFL